MKRQSAASAIFKCIGLALLFSVVQAFALFVIELVITSSLGIAGMSFSAMQDAVRDLYYRYAYEGLVLSALFFFGIFILMYLPPKKNPVYAASLRKTRPLHLAGGFVAGFASFAVASALVMVMQAFPGYASAGESYMESMESIANAGGALWSELLYVCLLGPIVEELLCRGLILNTLRRSFRPGVAMVLCGVAFGIIHGNIYQFVFTAPLGIFLAFLAIRYDSVFPGMLLHISFNTANYLANLGEYLGYSDTHPMYAALYYAAMIGFMLCIPLSFVLLKKSFAARREEIKENPPASYYVAPQKAPLPPYMPISPLPEAQKAANETLKTEGNDEIFMAQIEWIVVGLGNPGKNYETTRHNAGFIAMDYFAIRENLSPWQAKFHALCTVGEREGKKILFMKPQTFMNLSGQAVREAAAFYKIPPEKILVLFDDINFDPGVIRIRKNGSAGGHNGIKSIIGSIGSENFPRIKIGVGKLPENRDLIGWVLGTPSPEDTDKIVGAMEKIYSASRLITSEKIEEAMSSFNSRN